MKRVILKAPVGIALSDLTLEQQQAINAVFGQFVAPMPGTVQSGGYQLIDAVAGDDFNPDRIQALDLPFVVLGLWQWSGFGDMVEIQPVDPGYVNFLPDAAIRESHRWAGWPEAF